MAKGGASKQTKAPAKKDASKGKGVQGQPSNPTPISVAPPAPSGLKLPRYQRAGGQALEAWDLQKRLGDGYLIEASPLGLRPWDQLPVNTVGVYLDFFIHGLSFPLSSFFVDTLDMLDTPLSQVHPTFIRKIVAFENLCISHGVDASTQSFYDFYKPVRPQRGCHVYCHPVNLHSHLFRDRTRFKLADNWVDKFLLVRGPQPFRKCLSGYWKEFPSYAGVGCRQREYCDETIALRSLVNAPVHTEDYLPNFRNDLHPFVFCSCDFW